MSEFERRLAAAGFPDLSFALGNNVLRSLNTERGVRLGSLVESSGVTKQAISQQVAYLQERGYVVVEPDPTDSRAKLVWLTEKGRRSQEVARPEFGTVERAWRRRYGREAIDQLRATLEEIVGKQS